MKKTHSSSASISHLEKLKYNLRLLAMQIARRRTVDFSWLEKCYAEYDCYCSKYVRKPLRDCKTLEIGYGARPFRLIYLVAKGVEVSGVDLDAPLLEFSFSHVDRIFRTNGIERAMKSFVRWTVVQRVEYAALAKYCYEQTGYVDLRDPRKLLRKSSPRLTVGDASKGTFWCSSGGPFDFIYSEDVFEHIPSESLDDLLQHLAENISCDGIVLTRPNIFTGITGGHQLDWYEVATDRHRLSAPWDHLRKNMFPANTYLNKLSLSDYRERFRGLFDIVVEKTMNPDLGRTFLSPAIREELKHYPDEELFSNNVLFILKKKV
jgi:hypothetical protein